MFSLHYSNNKIKILHYFLFFTQSIESFKGKTRLRGNLMFFLTVKYRITFLSDNQNLNNKLGIIAPFPY